MERRAIVSDVILDPKRRSSIHFYRAENCRYAITNTENEYVGILLKWRNSSRAQSIIEVYAKNANYPAIPLFIPAYSLNADFEEIAPTREELLRYAEHVKNREFLDGSAKEQILVALNTCLNGGDHSVLTPPHSDVPDEELVREMISKVDRKRFALLYYASTKNFASLDFPKDEKIDLALRKWAKAKTDMYRLLGDLSVERPFPMVYCDKAVEELFVQTASRKYPRLSPLLSSLCYPYSCINGAKNCRLEKMMFEKRYDSTAPFSAIVSLTGETCWETVLNGILDEILSAPRSLVLSIDPCDYLSLKLKDKHTTDVSSMYGEDSILLYDKGSAWKGKRNGVLVEGCDNVEFIGGAYFSGTSCRIDYCSPWGAPSETERKACLRMQVEKLMEKAYGIPSDWIFSDFPCAVGYASTTFDHSGFPKFDVRIDNIF